MKRVHFQVKQGRLHPVSEDDEKAVKSFAENQIIRGDLYGVKKPRSVLQNNWLHNMLKIVAENTDDPDWDTPEKVKRNVKIKMKFFKDSVIVAKNRVYFELRSFAFDEMSHEEATVKYEEAKIICAKFLKVSPESLEANAQERG
ncbi:MAG TPA: hypothetical protein VMW84_01555 [Acidobacteriota bacterium]|nr:hypothetical protein [Acidobacteriota bacterium]